MARELSLDVLHSQLTATQKLQVTEETLQEVKKLAEDPDYGPEFIESYIDHLNIYKESHGRSHEQFLNALKFFSLVESGNSLTDAYIKLFPQRYEDRKKNYPPEEQKKDIMRSEASRFNSSKLVTEIKKVAAIPVQLVHRHILHEAILEQAHLMKNARSEMVRQKAAACLITELKPTEDNVIKLDVEDGASSAIDELRKATERLAAAERSRVKAGVPLKEIAESSIIVEGEVEVVVEDEVGSGS